MRPARMRSRVDFPQPDGPSKATTSLGRMARSMSASTSNCDPFGRRNECETPRVSINASEETTAFATDMIFLSLAQRESLLGERVTPFPDDSIENHHGQRHDHDARG